MNVLLVTYEYPPDRGGIATYLAYFAERFPTGRVTVLAPENEAAHGPDMASSAIIYRRRLTAGFLRPRWLPTLFQTWRHVRRGKPDALIVSHVLPVGQVARIIKRLLGIPYVVVIHGMDVASAHVAGGRKRRAARKVLRDADLIVANSAYTSLWLVSYGIAPEKAVIVPPPPSVPLEDRPDPDVRVRTRQRLGATEDVFVLLTVARLVSRKGIDIAMRAVTELVQKGRNVRYVVVGAGPDLPRLENLRDELRAEDVVTFEGAVDAARLGALYAAADAFIMTPRSEGPDVEGFGIVYLEAGLMELPVIGTRTGGVPEAVIDGETGVLAEPDDLASTIAAIERLMDDRAAAKRMGEVGRARVLDSYGGDRQAKRFMVAVKTLLK